MLCRFNFLRLPMCIEGYILTSVVSDVLRHPMGREEEIHNCKCVIDTLSMDILNTSLSHITGEDVVNCNRAAVANLLEVFHGLLEYILDRIGSDIDSEADGNSQTSFPPACPIIWSRRNLLFQYDHFHVSVHIIHPSWPQSSPLFVLAGFMSSTICLHVPVVVFDMSH